MICLMVNLLVILLNKNLCFIDAALELIQLAVDQGVNVTQVEFRNENRLK